MQYMAVWSWHIIGVIFLVGGFIMIFSGESIGNNIMFVVFIAMWVLSEIFAIRRKARIEMDGLGEEHEP